jgi:hypothetical protein
MLDQESLRPVILAMAIYITLVSLVPRIIKKPTGISVVDDLVMSMIVQKDSMMSGTILTGLIMFLSNYIQNEFM